LAFTADDGPRLAALAGEGQAHKRGGALRRGLRPVHTCGTIVEGAFSASPKLGGPAPGFLTQPEPVPVVARFSACDADPDADDRRWGPRGLAVRFGLPEGATADLVMMSADRFPASTRQGFESASAALSSPLPVRGLRVALLTAVHQFRSPWTFLLIFSPVSYAHLDYYAIHTFVWASRAGQPVRYRWRAASGRRRTRPWIRWTRRPDYLRRELAARLDAGGVDFDLEIQQPTDDVGPDRLRDVGRPLPRRVRWEPAGRLHLTRVVRPDEEGDLDRLLYSPAHLPEGVDAYPGDQIFTVRAAAYPASHVYRNGGSP
jgi:catalase